MENSSLKVTNILSEGYGIIPKKVMRDEALSIEAKAIYAFLSSFTGKGNVAFPSIGHITTKLGISEHRFYKHRKILIEKGYLKIEKIRNDNGIYTKNHYILNYEVPHEQKPHVDNPHVDKPRVDNVGTNKNIFNNNSINNNKEIKDNALFESWWDLYNKKKARPKALSAFNSALKKHDYETIEKGTINYLKSIEDKQYQSYPAKFLNQEQYMDEHLRKDNNVYENAAAAGSTSAGHDYLDGL